MIATSGHVTAEQVKFKSVPKTYSTILEDSHDKIIQLTTESDATAANTFEVV
jgi:hypothetical protein